MTWRFNGYGLGAERLRQIAAFWFGQQADEQMVFSNKEKKEQACRETIWDGFQGCCAIGAYGHPSTDEPSDIWL